MTTSEEPNCSNAKAILSELRVGDRISVQYDRLMLEEDREMQFKIHWVIINN